MERKRELIDRARGGSMGSIDELLKRKREEEEVKIFEKCKKTPRSPGGERKEEGLVREKRAKEDKSWLENWRGGGMMKEMMEEMRGWRDEMMARMKEEWREGRGEGWRRR